MAGLSNSSLHYYFVDGKLIAAVYWFGGEQYKVADEYDQIQALLEEKYGNEWENPGDTEYPKIIDTFLEDPTRLLDTIYKLDLNYIQLDDARVFINHVAAYMNAPQFSIEENMKFYGEHFLEYRMFTESEFEEMQRDLAAAEQREQEAQKAREKEIENERQNDL